MKIRFIEQIKNHPKIEIMPDSGNFDTLSGSITVSFFEYLDHEKVYRPLVFPNVNFGKMNPEDSLHWAKCFQAAYEISNKIMPESIGKLSHEVHLCWVRVNEVIDEESIIPF